jgi:hypothetical protein
MFYQVHLAWAGFELTLSVVIGKDTVKAKKVSNSSTSNIIFGWSTFLRMETSFSIICSCNMQKNINYMINIFLRLKYTIQNAFLLYSTIISFLQCYKIHWKIFFLKVSKDWWKTKLIYILWSVYTLFWSLICQLSPFLLMNYIAFWIFRKLLNEKYDEGIFCKTENAYYCYIISFK